MVGSLSKTYGLSRHKVAWLFSRSLNKVGKLISGKKVLGTYLILFVKAVKRKMGSG
jgi:hypothetical protein